MSRLSFRYQGSTTKLSANPMDVKDTTGLKVDNGMKGTTSLCECWEGAEVVKDGKVVKSMKNTNGMK